MTLYSVNQAMLFQLITELEKEQEVLCISNGRLVAANPSLQGISRGVGISVSREYKVVVIRIHEGFTAVKFLAKKERRLLFWH